MKKATKIYGVWKTDSAVVGECLEVIREASKDAAQVLFLWYNSINLNTENREGLGLGIRWESRLGTC